MTTPRDPDEILAGWLEEGPTRLPDQTRRAISVAIPTTQQRRRGRIAPWRPTSMNPIARTAIATIADVIVVGGAVAVLRPGGLTGTAATPPVASPGQSSNTSQQSPATSGESPVASPAAQTFTSKSSPPFTLDLPPEWATLDTGDTVKLRYLSEDFKVTSADIAYVDQIKVVGTDGIDQPAPTDFIDWLATSPLMQPVSEAVPMTIAGLPATRLDVVGSPKARPSGQLLPGFRFTFLSTDSGDLSIVAGEPWSFYLIEGPDGVRLLVSMREPTPDGLAKIDEALSTLQFP